MNRLSDIAHTGQVIYFAYHEQMIPCSAPEIARRTFQILSSSIPHASMHSKPITPDCLTAAALRVRNDLEVGIPLPNELKSRMFMAQTAEFEPVIVLCNYPANCRANGKKIAGLMPRDNDGLPVIQLPYGLSIRQVNNLKKYDLLDLLEGENSPYTRAAAALGIRIGEINPFSAMMCAEKAGIKILCLYDRQLFRHDILSTNAGARQLGVFVENGVEYVELAISMAKPVEIDSQAYGGAVVGDFAEMMEVYQHPPALAQLHLTLDALEKGARAGWQRR